MNVEKGSDTKFKRRRHRRSDLSITYRCAVCGDKTNCYNFGVPACEGCKGFYRRHMTRIGKMACSKDGNCEITIETRKTCLACRMRKCCEVGMQRDPLTKDTVMKPRRRKRKASGEKLKRGRKPGWKVNPSKQKARAAPNNKAQQNKTSCKKQLNKAKLQKHAKSTRGDFSAVTVDQQSSERVGLSRTSNTSELNENVVKRLAVSAPHEDINARRRGKTEQHTSDNDNGALAYAYSQKSVSSACTVGSPRSVSSVPLKKRKIVIDGQQSSPRQLRANSGGNSLTQLSTKPDASKYKNLAHDVSDGDVLSNDFLSPGSASNTERKTTVQQQQPQLAQSCSAQSRSFAACGSVNDDQTSALHLFDRRTPTESSISMERTEGSASCMVHDLEADSLYAISDAVYEQIMSDCVNLATTMSATWRRDELGDTLYDNPAIPDGGYQLRYVESRLHRMVLSLKRSRCFSTLTDSEKLVLMKASIPNVFVSVSSHCVSESGASVFERFDDGRVLERLCSGIVDVFLSYGVDLRHMFDLAIKYSSALFHCPLASDSPVLLSIFIIIMLFQVSVEQLEVECLLPSSASEPFTSTPQRDSDERARKLLAVRSGLEKKLAVIRREHAAFLRRFVTERAGDSFKGSEMWRFCCARLQDLTAISKICYEVTSEFLSFRPAQLAEILPLIDEVIGPKVEVEKVQLAHSKLAGQDNLTR